MNRLDGSLSVRERFKLVYGLLQLLAQAGINPARELSHDSNMQFSSQHREKLCVAWEAVLSRLIKEGFPEDACIETMMETGLSRLCSQSGVERAGAFLSALTGRLDAARSRKFADLAEAALVREDDAPFSWSTSGQSGARFGAWLRPASS